MFHPNVSAAIVAGLAALPTAAGAGAVGASPATQFPLVPVSQVQATGAKTLKTTLTLPYPAKYSQSIRSGRTVLCHTRATKLSAGTHKVACRVRQSALKTLSSLLAGSGTGARASQASVVYVQSEIEYMISSSDAAETLAQVFGEPTVVIYQTQRAPIDD